MLRVMAALTWSKFWYVFLCTHLTLALISVSCPMEPAQISGIVITAHQFSLLLPTLKFFGYAKPFYVVIDGEKAK